MKRFYRNLRIKPFLTVLANGKIHATALPFAGRNSILRSSFIIREGLHKAYPPYSDFSTA
jgi:hypothetical protein